jgi:hypothetical protein
MAKFLIEHNGAKYEVVAPDEATALNAFAESVGLNEDAAPAAPTERDKGPFGIPLMTPGIDRNPFVDAFEGLSTGGGVSPEDEAAGFERNMLLPRAVNRETGEQKWAVPGLLQGTFDAAVDAFKLPHDVLNNDSVTMTPDGRVSPLTDEQVGRGASMAAMIPGGVPAAVGRATVPALERGVIDAAQEIVPTTKPRTVASVRAASKAAYDQAENSGAIISPDALNILNHDFRKFAETEGLLLPDGKLVRDFPKVRTAFKALEQYARGPMTMKQAMTFQRQLRRAARSTDPEEARLGGMMLDNFEEYLSTLPAPAFSGGDGRAAVAAWAKGRREWHAYKKGQSIDDAVAAAYRKAHKFSGSGFENALRNEFERLASNEKKMRFFSKEERAFIQAVANGTPIANALRFMGKFAPTGVVGTSLTTLLGLSLGGPVTAGAMLGLGAAGRGAATVSTKKAAERARDFVLNGGREAIALGPTKPMPKIPGIGMQMVPQLTGREALIQTIDQARHRGPR